MHLCTIATVTVHICTIIVTLLSIILYFFLYPLSCLVSLSLTHSSMLRRRRRSRPSQQPNTTNHHHNNANTPKIIKIILNLDPNSSNPYTNSYINNQTEIEKGRRRRRCWREAKTADLPKITIFFTQNFCFLRPKSLPLIKHNPKSSSIIKA